jgi:hypothetical protein
MLKQTFGEGVDDRAATLSNPWPRGPKHIYHVMGRRAGSRTRPRAGTTPRESARSPRRSAAGSAPPGAARGRCAAGPRARACRIGIMCGMWRNLLRAANDFRIVSGYRRYDTGGCECDRPDRRTSSRMVFTLHPARPRVRACQAQGRGIDTTRVLRSARWTSAYFIVYSFDRPRLLWL